MESTRKKGSRLTFAEKVTKARERLHRHERAASKARHALDMLLNEENERIEAAWWRAMLANVLSPTTGGAE